MREDVRHLVELGGASAPVALDDEPAYRAAVRRRDVLSSHRDDTDAARDIKRRGVTLIRGTGRITSAGVVDIDGRQIGYRDLVVARAPAPRCQASKATSTWRFTARHKEPEAR